jgi:hypothetical protein
MSHFPAGWTAAGAAGAADVVAAMVAPAAGAGRSSGVPVMVVEVDREVWHAVRRRAMGRRERISGGINQVGVKRGQLPGYSVSVRGI